MALHKTEAEYMALSVAVQKIVHLRQMLKELKMEQKTATTIYTDNESALKLAKNPAFYQRSKHIDVGHHFTHERVARRDRASIERRERGGCLHEAVVQIEVRAASRSHACDSQPEQQRLTKSSRRADDCSVLLLKTHIT